MLPLGMAPTPSPTVSISLGVSLALLLVMLSVSDPNPHPRRDPAQELGTSLQQEGANSQEIFSGIRKVLGRLGGSVS